LLAERSSKALTGSNFLQAVKTKLLMA